MRYEKTGNQSLSRARCSLLPPGSTHIQPTYTGLFVSAGINLAVSIYSQVGFVSQGPAPALVLEAGTGQSFYFILLGVGVGGVHISQCLILFTYLQSKMLARQSGSYMQSQLPGVGDHLSPKIQGQPRQNNMTLLL